MPTTNSDRLASPPGRYVVQAGSTIAAALITGVSSDLPGQVVAQVTEDVFDSMTGATKLIPQGTRLILPDGRSLDLDRLINTFKRQDRSSSRRRSPGDRQSASGDHRQ